MMPAVVVVVVVFVANLQPLKIKSFFFFLVV